MNTVFGFYTLFIILCQHSPCVTKTGLLNELRHPMAADGNNSFGHRHSVTGMGGIRGGHGGVLM